MSRLEWAKEFEVGLESIDTQHRRLVDLINAVEVSLARGSFKATAQAALGAIDYAREHFSFEEALMARHGYPAEAEHKAMHAAFVATATETFRRSQKGEAEAGAQFLVYLQGWLVGHIMSEDKKLAAVLAAAGAK